jgi:hypothetical protein
MIPLELRVRFGLKIEELRILGRIRRGALGLVSNACAVFPFLPGFEIYM